MALESLRLRNDRRLAMTAAVLTLLPILWYARTDWALYSGDWVHLRQRLAARTLAALASIAVLPLLGWARTRERYSNVVLWYALWSAGFIIVINALRPYGSTLPLRSPLLTLFILYAALPNTFWRQCVPPWILSAALILLRLVWVTSGADGDIGGDIVIVLLANAFGVLLVRGRQALERSLKHAWSAEHDARIASERALDELKTLRGIIPICSHCRKVRAEVGGWKQLETYVRDHTEARFSHGICPDCLTVHYPDAAFQKARGSGANGPG